MQSRYGVHRGLILAGAVAFTLAVSAPSQASLLWDGDASKGTGVFKLIGSNCSSPGSVTAVSDAQQGTVWRYNKPSGLDRCESHGAKNGSTNLVFGNGSQYYLGWRYKLSSTVDNNAQFQWKVFPAPGPAGLNWPLALKVVNNRAVLLNRKGVNSDGSYEVYEIWSSPISANVWYNMVLHVQLSSARDGGYVEVWLNGVQQNLLGGTTRWACRLYDDEHVCPKWGVYGATNSAVINYVDALKIGTTFADANPGGGGGGSPTPTPAPTATPGPGPTNTPAPTATPGGGGSFSGYYRIMNAASGKALVVQSASTANSASVILWDYNDNTSDNDEWEIRSIGSGYHRIIARHSGKDMTVASASTANGANIFQYTYGGTATNDEWQLVDSGGGQFEIRNRNSGKNVQAMGTANGAAVQQQTDDDGSDQRYQIVSIP
jgi:ricin-type beta-trefoil lectin protein/polysaccharide lyase-like protein